MFIINPNDDAQIIHFNCNNHRICILMIIFAIIILVLICWIKLNNNNKIINKKY